MENSQLQQGHGEEMSSEQKNFHTDRRSRPQRFKQESGWSPFPRHRLVLLSLNLLNASLLLAAIVIGIYCAKAKEDYLQVPDSAATPLIIERNFLRNHSEIVKAKVEAEAALARERTNHVQLKLQIKQQKTLSDNLQSQIEILQTQKEKLQSNKTTLGWVYVRSSCYYFSSPEPNSKKNWPDSRADCRSRGGDLLVISNLEEQQLLREKTPKVLSSGMWWENGFWIGLTDIATRGTWVWINNVTEVETMYWRDEQPKQSGPQSGNCAALYYFEDSRRSWYNGNCAEHRYNWICEMEPDVKPLL
ncbi:C-type lectin domain family 3 member A-like [Aulostomus maculatus]